MLWMVEAMVLKSDIPITIVLSIILLLPIICHGNKVHSMDSTSGKKDKTCPPWATPTNETCKPLGTFGRVVTYDDNDGWIVSIPESYCLTYDELSNKSLVGNCVYTSHIAHLYKRMSGFPLKFHFKMKLKISDNVTFIDFCSQLQMNRAGQLCGRCEDGYALPVYSYNLACVKCSDYKYNWLKYIAVAFLPLTLFYVVVIMFRISATSGVLHGYVLVCQLFTWPSYIQILILQHNKQLTLSKVLISLHSIWNLDFFRSLYTPFCLHPNMSTLQTLALDYVIAVYPLLLIIITYFLVHLHDNYPVIVRLWRPFYKCFIRIRNKWEIRSNLIEAFATFLMLSYAKILNVSIGLLVPTTLYNVYGKQQGRYLFNDGTVEYFGKDHLPYGIISLCMILIFNILPLLMLCLYPCQCLQKCLNHFKLQSQVIYTFMDAFQGWYRTEPRDCRYFSALYFLIWTFILVMSYVTIGTALFLPITGPLLGGITLLVAVIKPYKRSLHNTVYIICLTCLTLLALFDPFMVYIKVLHGRAHSSYRIFRYLYGVPLFLTVMILDAGYLLYGVCPKSIRARIQRLWLKTISAFNREAEDTETRLLLYLPQTTADASNECSPLISQSVTKYAIMASND